MRALVLVLAAGLLVGCNNVQVDVTVKPDTSLPTAAQARIASLRFTVTGAETATATRRLATPFSRGTEKIVYSSSAKSGQLMVAVTGLDADGATVAAGSGSVALKPPFVHADITLSAATGPPGGDDMMMPAATDMAGVDAGVAMLSVNASAHDFGDVVDNGVSIPATLTVTNSGTAPSDMLATSLTGPNASVFAISNDQCAGAILPVGGSCTVGVRFAPKATGTGTATLGVAITGSSVAVQLTGNGLAPGALSFSPATFDFGTVDVGMSSTATLLTLTNTGGSPTTAITTSLSGGTAQFVVVSDGCKNMMLASGASCVVQVKFVPQTHGSTGLMVTASAVTGGTAQSSMTGTGRSQYTLTIAKTGNGAGALAAAGLTCNGATCSGTYSRTDVAPMVSISATPSVGSTLAWSGDCAGTGSPCVVTMDANRSATATFTLEQYTLSVANRYVAGAFGSVTSSVGGIQCGAACNATLDYNTMVTLTAKPNGTSQFQSWSGSCGGTQTTCTVAITEARSVTATFRAPINYAFATSTAVPTTIGGLAAADQACMTRAAAANLPGNFIAMLSTSTVDAKSRFTASRGWMRVDGKPVIDSMATTFANGQFYYPLNLDELGNAVNLATMTGTNSDGTKATGYTCGDWTSTTGDAEIGCPNCGALNWLGLGISVCGGNGFNLYCFQTDYSTTVTIPPQSGATAFVTKGFFDTNKGLTAADTLCQSEAQAANLQYPTLYKALLGTSTIAPASRFNATYQWVRTDGVPINASATSLFDKTTAWLVPLDATADGTYIGTYNIALGSDDPTRTSSLTCTDWTVDTGAGNAYFVQNAFPTALKSPFSYGCSQYAKLFCLYSNQ